MNDNLRAPPQKLVLTWGKNLKLSKDDALTVSNGLKLRHKLGKEKK
jgi:hypothetical protein